MSIGLNFGLGNRNVLCYDLHKSMVGQGACCAIDLSLDLANLHISVENPQNKSYGDPELYSEVKIWGHSNQATFIVKFFAKYLFFDKCN